MRPPTHTEMVYFQLVCFAICFGLYMVFDTGPWSVVITGTCAVSVLLIERRR